MSSVLETLIKGRAAIALPEHWTQFIWARNATGGPASCKNLSAVSFCSTGVLIKIGVPRDGSDPLRLAVVNALCAEMNGKIVKFNDTHTHSEVIAAWDRAIATEQKHLASV